MSAAIHIPPTRRSNPVFSQRHHHPNQPSPPISESMVRERLSANLPDSFNYLSSTRAVGRSHRPHSSSSSGAGSDRSATPPARAVRSGPGNERRSRPPHTFTRGSSSSSSCSSRSSSTSSDGGERYSFYARLAKIHRGGEPAALARCCDTVRGTLQLLKQAQLCTGDSDGAAGFFWLDLHGVPPPPRRGRAALRDADSGDAPMSALWGALGLQASTAHTFTTVCEQRQAHPRPARTLLDDVYEEEVVDFSCPDDRVLQVEPLRAPASAEPAMGVCDTGRCPEECVQLMHEQDSTAKRTPRDGVAGSAHYVALELATLLTPVHASAATMREAAWETALSPAPSAEEHANEPLNDLVWAGSLGRSMLSLPAAAAAIGRPAPPVLPAGLCQATQPSRHSQEPPAAVPLITSTYVVCFPAGCVTWCPASTLGLTSADRRAHRRAAAAEVQCVKSWEQLQTAVLRRMWHATHLSRGAAAFSPHARCGAAPGELSAPSMSVALTEPVMCTSIFVSLLLSSACYAYLPNTAKFLGEVDAIDSMLPLIEMNCESDQADALRRVLLLRRRLALHRRLLFQKICLLEALDRPAIHTAAGFIRSLKSPMWVPCSATPVRIAERCKSAEWDSASAGGDRSNHLNASCTDVPWRSGAGTPTGGVARSRHSSEGLDANDSNGRPSPDKSSSDHVAQRVTWAAPSLQHQMAAAPSLNAIHKGITSVLHNLEVARTVLGNTTLIYTSKVNFSNSRTSETADYFSLICQYVLIVVLPLNIVASHWGMNCPVPFMAVEGTTPFWGIVGVLAFIGVTGLIFPFYAYKTRRIYLIA